MRRARALPALLLALALACFMHITAGAGVFELQVLEFSNYRLRLASGACCGGAGAVAAAAAACGVPCRTRFTLCLKEYQSAAAPGACSFGRAASPVLGTDSFTLTDPLYTLALPFSFRWTRSFTLILQAFDDYKYPDEESGLIEEAWWSGIVEPGAEWHALRHAGPAAALAYRVRVTCQPNYYNTTCTTFCRPRDDKFGHYACSPSGDKVCLPGWQGDNCEKPVCKKDCHATHGRCDRPGDCDCRPGWRGELCSQCQPYPGCKHGYCNGSSWDCTCDTNWGGILCDQDLNYCGTHEPCQHGGTCENTAPDQYLCTCAEGFSGVDCERVDNPCAPQPCAHGACSLASAAPGFACACDTGWTGATCDIDIDDCVSAPCLNGATCRDLLDAFACDCAPGWTGDTCTDDVNECATVRELGMGDAAGTAGAAALGPCVNAATCNNTAGGYSCTCLAGWTGRDCEHNVDDCTGQCLNGATCIDLVDDFHCACAAGYSGRTCALDIDDCAPRPCRNGGECVDLLDSYRCICPVGFSGTDCELSSCNGRYCRDDRDHCAGAPCGNGATCYTAQSDYYCHCAAGWSGKNCTQRADGGAAPCVSGAACRHGVCVRRPPANTRCVCAPGYVGTLCADRIEDCMVSGCGAAGSCVDTGDGARCVCRAGWTGQQCDQEVNECAMNPCRNNATCVNGPVDFACLCTDGWTGKTCSVQADAVPCGDQVCGNGATCVSEAGTWRCACAVGWSGSACDVPVAVAGTCPCAHGTCTAHGGSWSCVCHSGWGGPHCDVTVDGCASSPCRNGGRCVGGTGWWACECSGAWSGADCSVARGACSPPCPPPATCEADALGPRCVCAADATPRANTRCLELIAGFGPEEITEAADVGSGRGTDAGGGGVGVGGDSACAANGTWWWGCNACWCAAGTPVCTRLWCGLPDCLAPAATPCRTDEVCVPAAPALCLRAPCAALGECRRVWGRRVEPPALAAPPGCWPGARPPPPDGCARARLQLARERLARGAHVERACVSLRRALAAGLAATASTTAPPPPLVLLCDLAPDDDDALDLALWIGEEEGNAGGASAAALGAAVRTLSELVSRRRLAAHALLGAALRLRVSHAPDAQPHEPPRGTPPVLLALAALGPLLLLAGAAAALYMRRRRATAAAAAAAAERSRRCDEEKSNNLQNEENLRRYANPLRPEAALRPPEELPRAHSLYKAQNADARNNTPPRDKELTKRALPPPDLPPARRPPPERLTVLV